MSSQTGVQRWFYQLTVWLICMLEVVSGGVRCTVKVHGVVGRAVKHSRPSVQKRIWVSRYLNILLLRFESVNTTHLYM